MMVGTVVALALPIFAQATPQPSDFEELLRQYQQAFEAEQTVSEISQVARETTTASVASRLNTPTSRAALLQTIANTNLPAAVRLAAIDALRRMGDVTGIEKQLLNSLAQIRQADGDMAARADAEEARLRRRHEEPRTTLENLPAESTRPHAAPVHGRVLPEDDVVYKRNLVFGGVAAGLAIMLLILRKRH